MPRTKNTNIVKRASSSSKETEAKKIDVSDMSSSPKSEDSSDCQGPDKKNTSPVRRPCRMKMLSGPLGNPYRYKDYTPEPEGSGAEAVAGGSGMGKACECSSRAHQNQPRAGKRSRILESPDHTAHSKRYAGYEKARQLMKMRNKRRQKRAAALKNKESSSSVEISSIDSAEHASSGGNHPDSSSSEQEQPKRARRVK